jgi:hypothetical protein
MRDLGREGQVIKREKKKRETGRENKCLDMQGEQFGCAG